MAIRFETVTDFLSEYGQLYIKGNTINMRCMLCGDSKKSLRKRRLSVVCDNGMSFYSCLNCGRSGTFAELVSELKGIPISEAIKQVESIEFDDIKKCLTSHPSAAKIEERIESDLSYIIKDCISINSDVSGIINTKYKEHLIKFIHDRKIPPEYANNIFVAITGRYKSRFIISIYHNNTIVYFQGRAIYDHMEPKFDNPLIEKTGIIMNIEYFQRDKYIIVTEGIIDAMMIENHQGTPVLGGSVSDDFLDKMFKHTDKGIIIAVDNDERGDKERYKLLNDSKYGKMLRYYLTPPPIKDLNEYKIKNNITNMYDTVVNNSVDHFTLSIRNSI